MDNTSTLQRKKITLSPLAAAAVAVGLSLVFALGIVLGDRYWLAWMAKLFPRAAPNLWGLVSRGHMLLLGVAVIAAWRKPRLFGFQVGSTLKLWRMLLIMLAANLAVVGGYLALSGATPYSGNEWLLTETVWVPLVEELVWRGVFFTLILVGLRGYFSEPARSTLAVWISGVVFGLLHGNNALYGVPLAFVAIQVLNATVWGVVYGYARAKTESIYPAMLLHAAMNLLVVLF